MGNGYRFSGRHLSPHFRVGEFKCQHCGRVVVSASLLDRLEKLRSNIGNTPVRIISAYRCLDCGRSTELCNSNLHSSGDAVDFTTCGKLNAAEVLLKVTGVFNCVGLNQLESGRKLSFIHVDTRSSLLYWLSRYDSDRGKRVYTYFNTVEHMLAAMRKDKQTDWFGMVV